MIYQTNNLSRNLMNDYSLIKQKYGYKKLHQLQISPRLTCSFSMVLNVDYNHNTFIYCLLMHEHRKILQVTTMSHAPPKSSKILEIYLLIAQYPMLASDIRRQMRDELFRRGIITPQRFDAEVKEKAVLSQQRERPSTMELLEENAEQWGLRWSRVRRTLTDFYFAYNLPVEILYHILDELRTPQADGRKPSLRITACPSTRSLHRWKWF